MYPEIWRSFQRSGRSKEKLFQKMAHYLDRRSARSIEGIAARWLWQKDPGSYYPDCSDLLLEALFLLSTDKNAGEPMETDAAVALRNFYIKA